MRIIAVLGGGGHTFEMLMVLRQLTVDCEVVYITNHDDFISKRKVEGKVFSILRPRKAAEYSLGVYFKTLISFIHAFLLLLWLRPKAVITNGPAIGAVVGMAARVLRIPVVFIESICRVETLSLTGRLLLGFAKLFIVQWPTLKKYSKKIVYGGRLF